jgi:hypothetical protein
MVVKNRFGRTNWPFAQRWAADGTDLEILVDEPVIYETHVSWGVSAP